MKIKLEVGKKYRNRKGEVVEITEERPGFKLPFTDGKTTYAQNGKYWSDGPQTIYELIEEVIDEPVKKPRKHAELIKAWADGKIIQEQRKSGFWVDCYENHPAWHRDYEYRIKPPEIPQWRKNLAEKMRAGGVLEFYDPNKCDWYTSNCAVGDVLNSKLCVNQENYRIRPEPKPDVVLYALVCKYKVASCNIERDSSDNLKLTWDGETGKLKNAEVLK